MTPIRSSMSTLRAAAARKPPKVTVQYDVITARLDDLSKQLDSQTMLMVDQSEDLAERFDLFVMAWEASKVRWWDKLASWFKRGIHGKAGEEV